MTADSESEKGTKKEGQAKAENPRNWIWVLMIVLLTFLLLYPAVKNEFTNWDDNSIVAENYLIRDLSFSKVYTLFTTTTLGHYLPLTLLTHAVEYQFFELNPKVYHFTNLFLHLVNVMLVYWLIMLLSSRQSVALITALIFGIHSMNVEPVAWNRIPGADLR